MSKEDPYRDQAERLRKRIERKSDAFQDDNASKTKDLPSRSQIHKHKRKKTKIKLKYPIIRLLVMFFILLPITIFSVYSYFEKQDKGKVEKVSEDTGGYETIDLTEEEDAEENDVVVAGEVEEGTTKEVEKETERDASNAAMTPDKTDMKSEDKKTSSEETKKPETKTENKPKPEEKKEEIVYHTVQASETLFRIAMKYYNSQAGIDIIKNANGIQNNEIQAGQVLKIPLNR